MQRLRRSPGACWSSVTDDKYKRTATEVQAFKAAGYRGQAATQEARLSAYSDGAKYKAPLQMKAKAFHGNPKSNVGFFVGH